MSSGTTADETAGVALGRQYLLFERIGAGAMGQVFRGTRRGTTDDLAIKVLRSELASDSALVRRFVNERMVLTALRGPHVVQVLDMVVEGDTLAIIMPREPAGSLRSHLDTLGGRLSSIEACDLAAQILDGLAEAHAADIVHRDVKPENILLERRGSSLIAKVTDFGISAMTRDSTLTRLTSIVGTAQYMAPELLTPGARATSAVDVYGAGVVLYELATGHTPFSGDEPLAILFQAATNTPDRPEGVSDSLWRVLESLLAKDPTARPSAADAAHELRELDLSLTSSPGGAPADDRGHARSNMNETQGNVRRIKVISAPPESVVDEPDPAATIVKGGRRRSCSLDGSVDLPGSASRRRRMILRSSLGGLCAVAVVVALLISGVLSSPNSVRGDSAGYRLPTIRFENSVSVRETWTSEQTAPARVSAIVNVVNSGATAVVQTYDLVIPKGLARTLRGVALTPRPASIVSADPIVRYCLPLQARAHRTIRYQVDSAAAPSSQHFAVWAQQWQATTAQDLATPVGVPCPGAAPNQPPATIDTKGAGGIGNPTSTTTISYGTTTTWPHGTTTTGPHGTTTTVSVLPPPPPKNPSWSSPVLVSSNGDFSSVSCVSSSFCAAAGGQNIWTYSNGSWHSPTSFAGNTFSSVSCVTQTFCMAVGSYTIAGSTSTSSYAFDGTSWTSSYTASNGTFYGVSCSSVTSCVAVGETAGSGIYTLAERYDGSLWSVIATPDLTAQVPAYGFGGVSCSSSTFCRAEGWVQNGPFFGSLIEAFDGNAWTVEQQNGYDGDTQSVLNSVFCAQSNICMAVGNNVYQRGSSPSYGIVVTYSGNNWSNNVAPTSTAMWSGSCTSLAFCMVSDANGNAWTYRSGAWSAPQNIDSHGFYLSCPSSGFCMAVDGYDALTYS